MTALQCNQSPKEQDGTVKEDKDIVILNLLGRYKSSSNIIVVAILETSQQLLCYMILQIGPQPDAAVADAAVAVVLVPALAFAVVATMPGLS